MNGMLSHVTGTSPTANSAGSGSNTPLISNGKNNNNSNGSSTAAKPQQLSSSNRPSAAASSKKSGSLRVTVLSAYDLPRRDPPTRCTVAIHDTVVSTGPPVQRHKDQNAVKFDKTSPLYIQSLTLADLYAATAVITLEYNNDNNNPLPLQATYDLRQLKVGETTWIILNMEDEDASLYSIPETPPSLRLQLTLDGPYRTEIAAIQRAGQAWFNFVDKYAAVVGRVQLPDAKYILIPAAPILGLIVVCLPILLGLLVVTLPMFLPLLVVALAIGAGVVACLAILWASTATGRAHCARTLSPCWQTVLSTDSGQRLVYQTGPRPTPVSVARMILPTNSMWAKLVVSLLLDGAGSASYLLPVAGELMDIGWAPFQTLCVMAMYDQDHPNLKYWSFVEEILPFTDIVPTATLGWLAEFAVPAVLGRKTDTTSRQPSSSLLRALAKSKGGNKRA